MSDALKSILPKAGAEAEKKAKVFKTTIPFPKGVMKRMVLSAIDKVVEKGLSLDKALLGLVPTEADYVMAVLGEREQWLAKNGLAGSLRNDQVLIEEAAKAIEETK